MLWFSFLLNGFLPGQSRWTAISRPVAVPMVVIALQLRQSSWKQPGCTRTTYQDYLFPVMLIERCSGKVAKNEDPYRPTFPRYTLPAVIQSFTSALWGRCYSFKFPVYSMFMGQWHLLADKGQHSPFCFVPLTCTAHLNLVPCTQKSVSSTRRTHK